MHSRLWSIHFQREPAVNKPPHDSPARNELNRPIGFIQGSVGSMPLQFLEIGFHVEIHAIEWHDFQRETQIHGVVVA